MFDSSGNVISEKRNAIFENKKFEKRKQKHNNKSRLFMRL